VRAFEKFVDERYICVREIKDYRGGKKAERKIFINKRKQYREECEKHRNKKADGAAVNFVMGNFYIFYMFRFKHIASYPKKTQAHNHTVNAENNYRELVVGIFTENRGREGN
jgi:hypothetical protein